MNAMKATKSFNIEKIKMQQVQLNQKRKGTEDQSNEAYINAQNSSSILKSKMGLIVDNIGNSRNQRGVEDGLLT
jgi:hypothetical protein